MRHTPDRFVSPIAPHLSDDLWQVMGYPGMASTSDWPVVDPQWLVAESIEIPVQINGKLRSRLQVAPGMAEQALVALAKAVAYGWGQVKANENAAEIARLGNELYSRLAVMAEPIVSLGKSLEGAAAHYNRFIGSMETRVFPTARQMRQLSPGESPKDLPDLKEIETAVRQPRTDGDLLPPSNPG